MKLEDAVRAVNQQIQMLSTVIQDTEAAIAALKALKEKGSGLVPLGAGVFIPVEMKEEKAVVGVGANVLMEKSMEEAVSILEKRRESAKKALEQAKKQHMALMEQARRVSI